MEHSERTKEELLAELGDLQAEYKQLHSLSLLNQLRLEALYKLIEMGKASEKDLLDYALDAAVLITESPLGYLAFVSDDEQVITMYSWSKGGMEDCLITQKPLVYYKDRMGLWGECLRQRKPIITNDYAMPSPLKKGLPEGHVALTRHMNVPIFNDDHIVLLAGVGNKETPYNEGDLQQLTLLMDGVWKILRKKRAEEANQRFLSEKEHTEMMRQSEMIKDNFISVISHELRTPLNAILAFSSLLSDEVLGPLNDQQQRAVAKVLLSSERMISLINDILDYTKMKAGTFEFFLEKVNYPNLIQEAVNTVASLANEKQITIETKVSVPIEVYLDPQRILQVLVNLLSNAIKFSPPERKVEIRASLDDSMLITEVEDSGIGIAPENIPKLFAQFRQLDMSLTRSVGGTGLGLSICKEIVEHLGGKISARSPGIGQGSVFCFSLPTHTLPQG